MNEVNRYNQGFGKFGPMEQCNDGKYMLANEAINTYEKLNTQHEQLQELARWSDEDLDTMKGYYYEAQDEIGHLNAIKVLLGTLLIGSLILNGILALRLLAN